MPSTSCLRRSDNRPCGNLSRPCHDVDVRILRGDREAVDIMTSQIHDAHMHRTTINMDEAVFRQVKAMARRKGLSIAKTIDLLLRSALHPEEGARVEPPLHQDNGPLAGVDVADMDRLQDIMDGR